MTQILMLLLVTLIIMSSQSFWTLWVCLELFSFFLMPWLMEGEAKTSKTNIFLYFLTQFLASMGLVVGSLSMFNSSATIILFSSLLLKLSCFPFHSWFVNVLPGISWEKIFVLMTLSKVLPLVVLTLFIPPKGFFWVVVWGLLVPLGGFNTSCMRSLLAYSSTAHSSWLLVSISVSKIIGCVYALVYFFVSFPLWHYLKSQSFVSLKTLLTAKKGVAHLALSVLALSGVPPLIGFIPKLLVMAALVQEGMVLEASILGVLSVLPIFFYLKMGCMGLVMKHSLEFVSTNSWGTLLVLVSSFSLIVASLVMLSLSLWVKH